MKKNTKLGVTAIVIAAISAFAISSETIKSKASNLPDFTLASNFESDGNKVSISEGKSEAYPTLDELEKHAEVIVKGRKLSGREVLTTTDIGTIDDLYTESSIEITQVFKGNLHKKETINVVEPVGTFKGVISSYEGYKGMATGKEYVLFLFKDPQNNRYGIVAVNQGKYSSDGSIELYSEGNDQPEYKRIEKFTKLVKDKYSKESSKDSDSVTDSVYK